jgi:hypothetical protein
MVWRGLWEVAHSFITLSCCYLDQGFVCCLYSRTGSTTFEQEEDAGGETWEDEDSSNEVSEGPRDVEVNRYNSSIHAEPFPGQPYSRWDLALLGPRCIIICAYKWRTNSPLLFLTHLVFSLYLSVDV